MFYGEKHRAIGGILRKLGEWKNVKILGAECCADHIHMLLEIRPKTGAYETSGYAGGYFLLVLTRPESPPLAFC
ncbi:Transposase for insertion sequence element IS200 [Erwinia piriflorinigrans CFBP 5888]|uniref:Transposase for insertion sequence element IS200 n=1 Tax=Erwinia piriflorinigrans CFBP 5888 TaxID=1161919 RepID=V5ZA18_9GAMM|nr:Transposase for insertion sequence element IS200 [Erwinia piriflorinigrans CFBP 5888]